MRRTVSDGIVLAAAMLVLACSPPTSPLDLAGIYTLRTVNGLPLPYLFPLAGTTQVEALDDTFTLNPGGTYAESGHKLFDVAGVVTVTYPIDAGNFTRRGDDITFESLIYGASMGTVSNGTLTLVEQGLTLVYQR